MSIQADKYRTILEDLPQNLSARHSRRAFLERVTFAACGEGEEFEVRQRN